MKVVIKLLVASRFSVVGRNQRPVETEINCFLAIFSSVVSTNAIPRIGESFCIDIPRGEYSFLNGPPKVVNVMYRLVQGVLTPIVEFAQDISHDYFTSFAEFPIPDDEVTKGRIEGFVQKERELFENELCPFLIKQGFNLESKA